MKIAKKFMALALATVLSAGCALSVSAAGSPTKEVTGVTADTGVYETDKKLTETESFATLKEKAEDVANAIEQYNAGTTTLDEFLQTVKDNLDKFEADEEVKKALEEAVEKLKDKEVITGFIEYQLIDIEKETEVTEDGKHIATFSVPSLTENMEEVQVVCFDPETGLVKVVDSYAFDPEAKEVKVLLEDLPEHCYISFVAKMKEETQSETDTAETTDAAETETTAE